MTLEAAIIEHCSPTLAGLKPASLFRYCPEEPEGFIPQFGLWRDALRRRGLELILLKGCRRSGAYLVYLYRQLQAAVRRGCAADQPDRGGMTAVES